MAAVEWTREAQVQEVHQQHQQLQLRQQGQQAARLADRKECDQVRTVPERRFVKVLPFSLEPGLTRQRDR